jgi:Na+/melibiose symporter-like transporter
MSENQNMNRAKFYQLAMFPMNNGATNVYYVLILSFIATFGNVVLGLGMAFASFMITGMRVFDAITDPIIGALMDKTNSKFIFLAANTLGVLVKISIPSFTG